MSLSQVASPPPQKSHDQLQVPNSPNFHAPLWGHQGTSGFSSAYQRLQGAIYVYSSLGWHMPHFWLSPPIFAPHCIVGSCEVMSSQTHGKQDRGPLFLYFLPQSVRRSLSSLDFPGVSIQREEGSVRSQKIGFLPLLSLFLGYFHPNSTA